LAQPFILQYPKEGVKFIVMDYSQPFKSVQDFCGDDDSLYWEIIEELKISIQNLAGAMETDTPHLDSLKFIAHKMKSTFRILSDEHFKQLLDDYVSWVEKNNSTGITKSRSLVLDQCNSYDQLIKTELSKKL